MLRKPVAVTLVVLAAALPSAGDTIRVGDRVHEGVYVSAGKSFYYVMDPADGSVFNVRKDSVDPSDVQVTEDPVARKALLKAWRAQQPGNPETPAAEEPIPVLQIPNAPAVVEEPSAPASPRAVAIALAERERLKSLVRFEAELEQWRLRPEEERRQILGGLVARRVEAEGEQALAAMAQEMAQAEASMRLNEVREQAAVHQEAVAESRAVQAEEVGSVLNNPRLRFYQDLLQDALLYSPLYYRPIGIWRVRDGDDDHNGDGDHDGDGDHGGDGDDGHDGDHGHHGRGIPIYYNPVYDYAYRAAAESARAEAEAAEIAREHAAFRRSHQQQLNALDREAAGVLAEQREVERRETNRARVAAMNARWAGTQLERLALMEAAVQEEYEPQLSFDSLGYWEGDRTLTSELLDLRSPVWKVDVKAEGAGRVRVKVYSEKDSRLVGLIPWTPGPMWDFLVIDTPGPHRVEIETEDSVRYAVEALEVRQ